MADDRDGLLWWDIRDARELEAPEKAILFAIASRGVAYASVETMAGDAGVSRASFHRHAPELVKRGLLRKRKPYGSRQAHYEVSREAVRALIPPKVSA